jgi:hypothetical protein
MCIKFIGRTEGIAAALSLDKCGQPYFEIFRLLSWILVDGCPHLSTENPPHQIQNFVWVISTPLKSLPISDPTLGHQRNESPIACSIFHNLLQKYR